MRFASRRTSARNILVNTCIAGGNDAGGGGSRGMLPWDRLKIVQSGNVAVSLSNWHLRLDRWMGKLSALCGSDNGTMIEHDGQRDLTCQVLFILFF